MDHNHKVKSGHYRSELQAERYIAWLEKEIEDGNDVEKRTELLQRARNWREEALKLEQQHVEWKKKLEQKREEMIENALAPIIDAACNDPDYSEKVSIEVELNPNFMNCGTCDHQDYTETEVVSKKHNLPVDPNQEEVFQRDFEMRCQQRKQKALEPIETKPELINTTEVVRELIDKLASRKVEN